jgi:hypothetical protein
MKPKKERIKISMMFDHQSSKHSIYDSVADVYMNRFCTNEKVPPEKYAAIKKAIEQILNDEQQNREPAN